MEWTPISTAQLEQLVQELKQNSSLVPALRFTLEQLLQNSSYTEWFNKSRLMKQPYRLPDELASKMQDFCLSDNGYLQWEVHRLLDGIFLTDLPAVDRRIGVYPYVNESEDIHEFIAQKSLYGWPNIVCDLFCGCGHHTIARSPKFWSNKVKRIGFDINERAICYATINALLNEVDVVIARNDIHNGLPTTLRTSPTDKVLFLANAPFFLAPVTNILPPSIDGGETGAALTFKALEVIKEFWQSTGLPTKAIVLAYTVGKSPTGEWEVVLKAEEIFNKENVEFTLLTDKKVVRIDGVNTVKVPAAIEDIGRKGQCKLDIRDEDRVEVQKGYANLIETLRLRGWSHAGYGIVYIDLPARSH